MDCDEGNNKDDGDDESVTLRLWWWHRDGSNDDDGDGVRRRRIDVLLENKLVDALIEDCILLCIMMGGELLYKYYDFL